MPDKHLYEYAVIRVVPRVEREEFLNIGVILYCPGLRFLKVEIAIKPPRLEAFCPDFDVSALENYLNAMDKICKGGIDGGLIAKLPLASRFRWLTATRSSVVQTSKVHPGFCLKPDETLSKLLDELVR